MKKPHDFTKEFMKKVADARANAIAQSHEAFVMAHIPRFHQMLMLVLPFTRHFFDYVLENVNGDPLKLILKCRGKIVARSYHLDD